MALTYTTDDFYSTMNNLMSSVQRPTPPNMTLIPNSSKQELLPNLAPKTKGPMTVQTASGALMSVPEGTPLHKTSISATTPTIIESAPTTTIDASSAYSMFDVEKLGKFRAIWGTTGNDSKDWQRYIDMAGKAKVASATLTAAGGIAGSILDISAAHRLVRDTEATKNQYETQKKIIDTNVADTTSALTENLQENMANLDVMAAAKNVDLSSQAIVGDKTKGAMDLGQDIEKMHRESSLQKAALDLQYARSVRAAKQARTDTVINSIISGAGAVASGALMLV